MFRSWPFRLLLFSIVIGATVLIAVNYWSRSGLIGEGAGDPLLSPEIVRRSTDFEYAQLKEDRVLFKVLARTSTTLRDGGHLLDQVHLTRFNPEGDPVDTIEARGAVYRIAQRDIEFREDVLIRLEDGTEIRADWAGADLAEELVSIRESFRFSRGEVRGTGRDLEYSIPERTIHVKEGLNLDLPGGGARAYSASREALYRLADGRLRLTSDARIRMADTELAARVIDLTFSGERRIEGVTALGSALLKASEEKSFAGDSIRIQLSDFPETGRIDVRGERGAPAGRHSALFRETTESGSHELRAANIVGFFDGDGADRLRFHSVRAQRDVSLRSSPAGIDDGRADYFRGDMSSEDGRFETLILSGNVRLERGGTPPGEVLDAARVQLWLGPDSALRRAEASGPVRISIAAEGGVRRLEAEDRLRLDYRDGLVHEALATGGCLLEREAAEERSRLTAGTVHLSLEQGRLERVVAAGDVEVATRGESGAYTSWSERLTLEYAEGLLLRSRHEGGFQLTRVRQGEEREAGLSGEGAVYETASRLLVVDGSTRARLRLAGPEEDFVTTADSIWVSPHGQEITARGAVESVMEGGEARIVVTAGEMFLDPENGWIVYGDRPRMVQGANLIAGRNIRINRESGHLIVDEEVDSYLVEEAGAESRSYHIQARRLTLMDDGRKALYEGDVVFEGAELRLDAPRLEAFFEDGGEYSLDRVEATGGVVIVERGRRWQAERATYVREADRVVVAR